MRQVLYLATLSAVRYNPALRAFRDRLGSRGKKAKVIRTAAAPGIKSGRWRAEGHRTIPALRRAFGP